MALRPNKPVTVSAGDLSYSCALKDVGVLEWDVKEKCWSNLLRRMHNKHHARLLKEYGSSQGAVDALFSKETIEDPDGKPVDKFHLVIVDEVFRSDEYVVASDKRRQDLIAMGTVEGKQAVTALVDLGGQKFGPELVEQLATEVYNFHVLSPQKGES